MQYDTVLQTGAYVLNYIREIILVKEKAEGEKLYRVPNILNYRTMSDFKTRLKEEAQELAIKTNALNDFMRTQAFVDLDRENKDLLYKQSRLMNEYLQVLGQRLELLGDKFAFKN